MIIADFYDGLVMSITYLVLKLNKLYNMDEEL